MTAGWSAWAQQADQRLQDDTAGAFAYLHPTVPTLDRVGADTGTQASSVRAGRRFYRFDPIVQSRAPRWWQELTLVLIGYWIYRFVRNSIQADPTSAMRHARAVEHLQSDLGLSFEQPVNSWVASHEVVAQVMNYYYATLHFIVTIGVSWSGCSWPTRASTAAYAPCCSSRHPHRADRLLRLPAGAAATAAAVRLRRHPGASSTPGARWPTRRSPSTPTSIAAMPSLHIGVGAVVRDHHLRVRPQRLGCVCLALCYPFVTLLVDRRHRQPLRRRRGGRCGRGRRRRSRCR